ncbi:MAG: PAS domain S-box protein [Victivallales bacterium]|jgi:PAS domain S-box-containing protein
MKRAMMQTISRVVLPFILFASLWIFLSEWLLSVLLPDPAAHAQWFIYMGWFFVLVTSLLLFFLLRKEWGERIQIENSLHRTNRTLRMISECNQVLIRATTETELLQKICDLLVNYGGYRMAWVGSVEQDEAKSVNPVAQAGFGDGYLDTVSISWADTETGRGPTGTAIRTGHPVIARDIPSDPAFGHWREEAIRRGYTSSAALPLTGNGHTFGALMIYAAVADAFDAEELVLLTELAANLAYGITALRTRTEHQCAEEMLRESEERLRRLGDNLPNGMMYQVIRELDGRQRFIYVSAGVERLNGVKPEAVLGDPGVLYGQIVEEDRAKVAEVEEASLRSLTDFNVEARIRNARGELCWVQLCSAPRLLADGRVLWDGIQMDITERKQAELARQAAEQRLADIIELLPDATFVIDQDKRVIEWNRACEIMTGVKKEELLGKGDYAYAEPFFGERRPILIDLLDMPSSEMEAIYKYVQRKGDMIFAESYIPYLRDGKGAHLWGAASPFFDREGRRCGAIETIRDVTDQKQVEKALRENERKYRELVEHANSIILRWGRDGRITFLNEFGQHFFGYTEAEICGRHVMDTIVPESESGGRSLHELMDEICSNPSAFEQNINENMRRNGERVWIAWTNKIVLDQKGQVAEILSIGLDITARKRAVEELQAIKAGLEQRVIERTAELAAAKDRAESADRVKSAFLATMSHELRTPLNSIIGFTGLLLQGLAGSLNAEQTKQLRMVKDSGQHLLALINDVLDISKLEAGQIEIANLQVNLRESIQKIVQAVTPLADKKQLPLIVQISPDVSVITSDRRRIEQILLNLLSNAIKFTERGKVTLTAEIVSGAASSPQPTVRISVADTGIGVKTEDLDKLFQPFRQLDTGLTRQYEGTGLGLAICKRMIERLHGTIEVASEWGKGSTFKITLPIHPERRT